MRLAEEGAYRLLWSEQVLTELQRNLTERVGAAAALRRVAAMRAAFPDAAVRGIGTLRSGCRLRTVTGMLLRLPCMRGEVIVTANLRHSPVGALAALHVLPRHPDEFLLDQLDLYPEIVGRCLEDLADSYERPPLTIEQILDRLALDVPQFVTAVRANQ